MDIEAWFDRAILSLVRRITVDDTNFLFLSVDNQAFGASTPCHIRVHSSVNFLHASASCWSFFGVPTYRIILEPVVFDDCYDRHFHT